MTVKEYGKQNSRVIILLHGGGLSWWNYRDCAELLSGEYHVVLPVLDGHADSDTHFTTIEDNAAQLISYVDGNFGGRVEAMGGLSLGAQMLVEALSQRGSLCKCALIESALVLPMPATAALVEPMFKMSYGLIKKEWFARVQFKSLKIKPELFDDYYRDSCKIELSDMVNFLKSNSTYSVKPQLSDCSARVLVAVGAREQRKMRRSAEILHETLHNSSLKVLEGYYHGELSLNHPTKYVGLLRELIKSAE